MAGEILDSSESAILTAIRMVHSDVKGIHKKMDNGLCPSGIKNASEITALAVRVDAIESTDFPEPQSDPDAPQDSTRSRNGMDLKAGLKGIELHVDKVKNLDKVFGFVWKAAVLVVGLAIIYHVVMLRIEAGQTLFASAPSARTEVALADNPSTGDAQ